MKLFILYFCSAEENVHFNDMEASPGSFLSHEAPSSPAFVLTMNNTVVGDSSATFWLLRLIFE